MPHQHPPHGPQHSHSHAHAAPNLAAKTMGAAVALTLLFDPEHNLEERILLEQFLP